MIPVKTSDELDVLREGGAVLAGVLEEIWAIVVPGQDTETLDRLAEELIIASGGKPAFKGLYGFPATICSSINEEVVHGIPSKDRKLENGDILSIDIGLQWKGMFADMATTVPVGEISPEASRLLAVTEESLWKGISAVKVSNRLSDVSHAIGSFVEDKGFFVIKEYVGHGIGRRVHEDPQIPNYGVPGQGPRLTPGMVFAIEPMVQTGCCTTEILDDEWTVVTGDGGLSAHFEHTMVLTESGVEVLTQGGELVRSG